MPASEAIAEVLERAGRLPAAAVVAVFRRYGRPLEEAPPPLSEGEARAEWVMEDGELLTVRAITLQTRVDVIGNDWFILTGAGEEALAMPGPLFAAAVAALAKVGER